MPRSRTGLVKPRAPAPRPPDNDDELDEDFGREPEVDEDDLPAAPALPSGMRDEPSPPPQSMVDLGAPPDDAAGMAKWAYKMLMAQAYETVRDNTIGQATRRREVRQILAGAARHFPDAARYDIKKAIDESREKIESKKKMRAQAKAESRGVTTGRVIPIRRDG